jgi:hypothetical protein
MSFPNLVLRDDASGPDGKSQLWAEAEGTPSNGDNTFTIPFALAKALGGAGLPADLVDANWLKFTAYPATPAVSGVTDVGPDFTLSADKLSVTMPFATNGTGTCKIVCQLVHTIER